MKLYSHQLESSKRASELDYYAFFFEAGAGKTAAVINTIKLRLGSFPRTIIVSPKITLSNWNKEIRMWTDETDIGICGGTTINKLKILKKNKVVIMNYEAFRSKEIQEAIMLFNPEVMILDESHRIKNHKAMQTKAILKTSMGTKYRYILSGTAITNTKMDLYAQYLFLNQGKSFGSNFFAFRGKYFVNKNANWNSPKAFPNFTYNHFMNEDFMERISYCTSFVKAKDVIDLPELVEQVIEVELSKPQEKHYKEMRNELITWLDSQPDSPLLASNALTKILRLNEILNGYIKISEDYVEDIENPRLDYCMDLIRELLPNKIIIYCIYKKNYEHLRNAMKKEYIKFIEIHGESMNDVYSSVDKFNNFDSGFNVCICNPRSGGIGINLKSAKYSIYYSRNFSLEEYEQSRARNYRAGSIDLHKKIVHYQLVTPKTIDELIYNKLKEKNAILSDLGSIRNLLKGDSI